MVSRYNDPKHPANSGSLIGLLTGGAINPAARQQARREAKQECKEVKCGYKDARRIARSHAPRGPRRVERKGPGKDYHQEDHATRRAVYSDCEFS